MNQKFQPTHYQLFRVKHLWSPDVPNDLDEFRLLARALAEAGQEIVKYADHDCFRVLPINTSDWTKAETISKHKLVDVQLRCIWSPPFTHCLTPDSDSSQCYRVDIIAELFFCK